MDRSFIPKVVGWVPVAAMATGLLLTVIASALPERWQEGGLLLGVGLTFACIDALLLNLATARCRSWRGLATVIGGVLGALPVLGLVAWHNLHDQPDAATRAIRRQATTPVSIGSPLRVDKPSSAPAPARPPTRDQVASHASNAGQGLEPAIAELDNILNKRAQPAVDNQYRLVSSLLRRGAARRELDAGYLRPALDSAVRDLTDVQTSLGRLSADHHEVRKELDTLIGDTHPLAELISGLQNLAGSIDAGIDVLTLTRMTDGPRSESGFVSQWITECNRRIAELRAGGSADHEVAGVASVPLTRR